MYKYKNREFNSLIQPIAENEEFLKTKDISNLTPLEALIYLNDIQKKLRWFFTFLREINDSC